MRGGQGSLSKSRPGAPGSQTSWAGSRPTRAGDQGFPSRRTVLGKSLRGGGEGPGQKPDLLANYRRLVLVLQAPPRSLMKHFSGVCPGTEGRHLSIGTFRLCCVGAGWVPCAPHAQCQRSPRRQEVCTTSLRQEVVKWDAHEAVQTYKETHYVSGWRKKCG